MSLTASIDVADIVVVARVVSYEPDAQQKAESEAEKNKNKNYSGV